MLRDRGPHTLNPTTPNKMNDQNNISAGRGAGLDSSLATGSASVPTPEEARDILSRFNASHFNLSGREHARYRIPADPKHDDDLRMSAFINYTEELGELLRQMLDVAENCDETGYADGVGFVDLDDLHARVRAALSPNASGEPCPPSANQSPKHHE
jgi:hypothetical protein